ncbi:hypothetical protein ACFO5O_01030 [Geojedonia litorea]|uniref:PKD/Chitinase domain-containing protein n=1 Tax=Geojedonia litorea TaxID=1268269 RepID=A0ABV9MY25_9FLAO
MKTIKYLITGCFAILVLINCTTDDNNLDYLNNVEAPTNVVAIFKPTQDNSGLVTITPNSEGAVSYNITFGDDTATPQKVNQGESVDHIYEEGTYTVKIEAVGITGLKSEATQNLVVSFRAPENLEVVIENDLAISKRVNVTANADFAISYDVYFGEAGNDTPVTGNIGDTVSYVYQEAGTYTIRVVAIGAAIETTEYIVDFEVTAILQPLASAPTPPARAAQDVISIFSAVYEDEPGTDFFPDWGQGACCGSSWTTFDLNGDLMLQYINLSYQGNQFQTPVDVSGMEYVHIDIWNAGDVARVELSLISLTNGEKPVWIDLTANDWTSVDIPITAWTDQGLTVADIHQLKYVGDPFSGGTVFIDNIYFYKPPSEFIEFPINFESNNLTYTWNGFGASNFGPIPAATVANPNPMGINNSATVVEIQKPAGAQVWAGASMNLSGPADFTDGTTITLKVWSPRAGVPILFKMEDKNSPPDGNGNPSVVVEVQATTTLANTWEELSFDLTSFGAFSTSIDYHNVIIFPDFGNAGTGETFYFDDIEIASINFPINFEVSTLSYTWNGFGASDFGPIPAATVANPNPTGINNSATVAEIQKPAGAQVWAGAAMNLTEPADFSNGTTVKIKVWSPRAGVPILFKMEDKNSPPDGNGNPSVVVEVQATTTLANAWEVLSFDLTSFGAFSTSIEYHNVIIFPDFGNGGTGETFYFDDIIITN